MRVPEVEYLLCMYMYADPRRHVLATSNKNPKMHVLICNFHWSRSQKYTKDLQLHIRVLVAGREYSMYVPSQQGSAHCAHLQQLARRCGNINC
ncbi:hypothetical protein P167DRAFT_225782 [Morchella conica CCBAS932]|uniref:Uncharacterized protein n=1 Tax=Morchella conica CCBAS932 TaxID=1392247 RepID=A0A3N4KKR5_9PEZI|nr:hypothetical protein P167DRAFT_225782 [Morchella conica CCBAS932]